VLSVIRSCGSAAVCETFRMMFVVLRQSVHCNAERVAQCWRGSGIFNHSVKLDYISSAWLVKCLCCLPLQVAFVLIVCQGETAALIGYVFLTLVYWFVFVAACGSVCCILS